MPNFLPIERYVIDVKSSKYLPNFLIGKFRQYSDNKFVFEDPPSLDARKLFEFQAAKMIRFVPQRELVCEELKARPNSLLPVDDDMALFAFAIHIRLYVKLRDWESSEYRVDQ